MMRPLASLAFALAACGGEGAAPAASAAASETNAADASGCPWLPSDVASRLLATPVTVGSDGMDDCTLDSEPNTFHGRLHVDPTPLGGTLAMALGPYENAAGYGARQPIQGLGDRAAWVGHAYPGGGYGGLKLVFERGGRVVDLSLSPSPPRADLPARAEALARAVAERL